MAGMSRMGWQRGLVGGMAGALALASLAVSSAPVGAAPTPVLTDFADMLVDEAHGRVLVSQGTNAGDAVLVADLAGNIKSAITGLSGADGMTFDENRSTIYVGLHDGAAVAAIDAATLQVKKFPTGTNTCPGSLAMTGGVVYFSQSCGAEGLIGALDPDTGVVSLNVADTDSRPILASSPQLPGRVFALARYSVTGDLYAFQATPAPVLVLQQVARRADAGSAARDLAVSADGQSVITAQSGGEHRVFRSQDLAPDGSYKTVRFPTAVAVRADGMVAAGGPASSGSPDLVLFAPGSRTAYRGYTLDDPDRAPADRGLAFGSSVLYVVTESLRILALTPRRAASLQMTSDRKSYRAGDRANLDIVLSTPSANRLVKVYDDRAGKKPRRLLATVTVPANGRARVPVKVDRNAVVTAVTEGDAETDPATVSISLQAQPRIEQRLKGAHSRRGQTWLVRVQRSAVLQARLAPRHAGDCLHFRAQFFVRGSWKYDGTTGCVRMSRSSSASAILEGRRGYLGIPIRMRAEWKGDQENVKVKAPWVYLSFVR